MRAADAFVGACLDAQDYFEELGAPQSRIWKSLLTTDISAFMRRKDDGRTNVAALRRQLGITGKVILYCGKLAHEKGVGLLLRSFSKVQGEHPDASLLLVGSGVEEPGFRDTVAQLSLRNVHFVGFQQPSDLPSWYHMADLFVFPTLCDRFGVVVVEAVASELPIVCSKFAGAARDLVVDGKNGFVVDPLDVTALSKRILSILGDDALASRMAAHAREVRKLCDVDLAAGQFMKAIECAAATREVAQASMS